MKRFAVVCFTWQDFDDGESVGSSTCVARFATEKEAEEWRARRYGRDDTCSMVIED